MEGLQWLQTDDGSLTLWDADLDETYHSGCGALAESLVVYLQYSGVAQRLMSGQSTHVLEYGLGTATAFLLTAGLAQATRTPLDYWAFENKLLSSEIWRELPLRESLVHLQQAHPAQTCLPIDIAEHVEQLQVSLVRARATLVDDHPLDTKHEIVRWSLSPDVQLNVCLGDARQLEVQASVPRDYFHSAYFDPFSPETNPQLWTEAALESACSHLRVSGTLTSYCVKSNVRRALQHLGMQVEKLPGPPGGKREVLRAYKRSQTTRAR